MALQKQNTSKIDLNLQDLPITEEEIIKLAQEKISSSKNKYFTISKARAEYEKHYIKNEQLVNFDTEQKYKSMMTGGGIRQKQKISGIWKLFEEEICDEQVNHRRKKAKNDVLVNNNQITNENDLNLPVQIPATSKQSDYFDEQESFHTEDLDSVRGLNEIVPIASLNKTPNVNYFRKMTNKMEQISKSQHKADSQFLNENIRGNLGQNMSVSLKLKQKRDQDSSALKKDAVEQSNKMNTFNESSLTRKLRGHKDPKIIQEIDAIYNGESYDQLIYFDGESQFDRSQNQLQNELSLMKLQDTFSPLKSIKIAQLERVSDKIMEEVYDQVRQDSLKMVKVEEKEYIQGQKSDQSDKLMAKVQRGYKTEKVEEENIRFDPSTLNFNDQSESNLYNKASDQQDNKPQREINEQVMHKINKLNLSTFKRKQDRVLSLYSSAQITIPNDANIVKSILKAESIIPKRQPLKPSKSQKKKSSKKLEKANTTIIEKLKSQKTKFFSLLNINNFANAVENKNESTNQMEQQENKRKTQAQVDPPKNPLLTGWGKSSLGDISDTNSSVSSMNHIASHFDSSLFTDSEDMEYINEEQEDVEKAVDTKNNHDSIDFGRSKNEEQNSKEKSTIHQQQSQAGLKKDEKMFRRVKSKYFDTMQATATSQPENEFRLQRDMTLITPSRIHKRSFCQRLLKSVNPQIRVPWQEMTVHQQQIRLEYLRSRAKHALIASIFITRLRINARKSLEERLKYQLFAPDHEETSDKKNNNMNISEPQLTFGDLMHIFWGIIESLALWFTLITTPLIMIWPEIQTNLINLLWTNEIIWALDIGYKFFFTKISGSQDQFDVAFAYLKSNFIFDFMSLFPQLASGLHLRFVPLKMFRYYQTHLIVYPLEVLVDIFFNYQKRKKTNIIVFIDYLLKIFALAHQLCCVWIYIGSELFADYEEGKPSFTVANSDFHDASQTSIYVFSYYWIFTVITTVGYGDYTGGNSLELSYSMGLEFTGLMTFSVLMLSLGRVIGAQYSFQDYLQDKYWNLNLWILMLEKSNKPLHMTSHLFNQIQACLQTSFKNDFNVIEKEHNLFSKIPFKDQTLIITQIFGWFLDQHDTFFDRCDQGFINQVVVSLKSQIFQSGQIVQSSGIDVQDLFFLQSGNIILCENSTYQEPIMVYSKGAVLNLYSILMKTKSQFVMRATYQDEYVQREDNYVTFNGLHYERRDAVLDNDSGVRLDIFTELMSLPGEKLKFFCSIWPDSAKLVYRYALNQIRKLRDVRQLGDHLNVIKIPQRKPSSKRSGFVKNFNLKIPTAVKTKEQEHKLLAQSKQFQSFGVIRNQSLRSQVSIRSIRKDELSFFIQEKFDSDEDKDMKQRIKSLDEKLENILQAINLTQNKGQRKQKGIKNAKIYAQQKFQLDRKFLKARKRILERRKNSSDCTLAQPESDLLTQQNQQAITYSRQYTDENSSSFMSENESSFFQDQDEDDQFRLLMQKQTQISIAKPSQDLTNLQMEIQRSGLRNLPKDSTQSLPTKKEQSRMRAISDQAIDTGADPVPDPSSRSGFTGIQLVSSTNQRDQQSRDAQIANSNNQRSFQSQNQQLLIIQRQQQNQQDEVINSQQQIDAFKTPTVSNSTPQNAPNLQHKLKLNFGSENNTSNVYDNNQYQPNFDSSRSQNLHTGLQLSPKHLDLTEQSQQKQQKQIQFIGERGMSSGVNQAVNSSASRAIGGSSSSQIGIQLESSQVQHWQQQKAATTTPDLVALGSQSNLINQNGRVNLNRIDEMEEESKDRSPVARMETKGKSTMQSYMRDQNQKSYSGDKRSSEEIIGPASRNHTYNLS